MSKASSPETRLIMFADQLAGKEIALGKMRGLATREGMETIAQRLARLRKERGITQEEMAHLLGISQPIVSDYERGELRLHGELIVKLVKILGVTADEILGLESSRNNNTLKSRRFLRRIQQIEKLSKRDQEAVLRTIDAFLAKSS